MGFQKLTVTILLLGLLMAFKARGQNALRDDGPIFEKVADTTLLTTFVNQQLQKAETALAEAKSEKATYTYQNTLIPFKKATYHYSVAQYLPATFKDNHPDTSYQNVAIRLYQEAGDKNTMDFDEALYKTLLLVDTTSLSEVQTYQHNRTIKNYERSGIQLEESKKKQLQSLNRKIAKLGNRWMESLNTSEVSLQFHKDSLSGIPNDLLNNLPKSEDDKVVMPLIPPVATPFFVYADQASVRKKVMREMMSMGYPDNYVILDSIRILRQDMAELLGYQNYAQLSLEPMLINQIDKLKELFENTTQITREAIKKDEQALLELKQKDYPNSNLELWDVPYYSEKRMMQDYGFDSRQIREYFPYNQVEKGVLETYSRMFDIEFRPIETQLWAEEAKAFEVYQNEKLLGRVYLDMHPRIGKSTGDRMTYFSLGGQLLPELILICNQPQTTESDPGLMDLPAVKTFFHEFGHLMHYLFYGQQDFPGSFERDFVEAPSQLFEEWAVNPGILRQFARHYQSGKVIPEELLTSYQNSIKFGRAPDVGAMASGGYIALQLYTNAPEEKSIDDIMKEGMNKFGNLPIPDDFHLASGWHHLYHMGPRFYTYLFSGILARDLLTGFDPNDLSSPEAGEAYREKLLASTGNAPSLQLVADFLGRPFNYIAWEAWLSGKN
jgi:thimet oligopeptidase